MGQIEIDEIYVGVNRRGIHFIIPVQAKGGSDRLSPIQTRQDALYCEQKFPSLICRLVSAQFMPDKTIAMFELGLQNSEVRIVEEKHYQLVPADEITGDDLTRYRQTE